MKSWKEWKNVDAEYARDFGARMEELMPEPLFESFHLPSPKVCLCCAKARATSLLYSPFGMQPVLPLCSGCAADWNFAGYAILKRIRPKTLMLRLITYKLKHPLSRPSVLDLTRDVQQMLRWSRKMSRLRKQEPT